MATKQIAPSYALEDNQTIQIPSRIYGGTIELLYDVSNLNVESISANITGRIINQDGHPKGGTVVVGYKYVKYETSTVANITDYTDYKTQTLSIGSTSFNFPIQFTTSQSAESSTYLCLSISIRSSAFEVYVDASPALTVSYSGTNGGEGGSEQTNKVTVSPSSPSGGGTSFATNVTFSWSISSLTNLPEKCTYLGTRIQMTLATDTTGSAIFYDKVISGLTNQHVYTGTFNPNTSYIWRTCAVIDTTEKLQPEAPGTIIDFPDEIIEPVTPESGDDDTPTVETPWSDWRAFTTKDYEYVNVRVTTSSPDNEDSFVEGKDFTFSWSINGGSGVTIDSSTIMIDGNVFATVTGTTTSYNYKGNSGLLTKGAHLWYVVANVSTDNNGIQLNGTPSSERQTFYISDPVATATPSSPNGSTSVKGNAPVPFSWSISKDGDGIYTGSQLEYRYSTETVWRYLGETQDNVSSFTYEEGFAPNTVVQWHVRTGLNGIYAQNGGWSEPTSFTVGDVEIYDATPSLVQPKGTVKGDSLPLIFAWTVKSDGEVSGCQLEISTDGGITWRGLSPIKKQSENYIYECNELLPAGSIEYRVRAKANGPEYGEWVQSSFTITYDAYGSVVIDSSLANLALRRDQQLDVKGLLSIVGQTTESITFKNATFCWRMASGTEFREETMTVSGVKANLVLPAYKFPTGILYWYLKAKDSKDNDSETPMQHAYILVSSIDTFPVEPQSVIHEADQALPFSWGIIAQNKKVSKSTEIRFSKDGVNFDEPILLDANVSSVSPTIVDAENVELSELFTAVGHYTFSEEYFSAGRVYWQIRSTTSDGVVGEWSESSLFIVRGLPKIQSFTCDSKPFATFCWTANEQSSYEICIDDVLYYGPFHGNATSFTLPEPLEDGDHTAALHIQNHLGAVSNKANLSFQVHNIASVSSSLRLLVSADIDAELLWHPVNISSDNEFLVYRDNTLIARLKSDVNTYRDRLVLGRHNYRVVQRLSNNYYDLYLHDPVAMHSYITRVGLLDGGSWIELVLTKEPYPTHNFTHRRILEKTRVMGTKYPVLEVSNFEETSGSYAVCWPYENYDQMALFNSLVGLAIIIKSRADMVLCGVLESCEFAVNSQYIECTFSLEEMSTDQDLSIAIKPEDPFDYMTNLDKVYFGQLNETGLSLIATNPGYTNPKYYEEIAEAINARIRSNPASKRKN